MVDIVLFQSWALRWHCHMFHSLPAGFAEAKDVGCIRHHPSVKVTILFFLVTSTLLKPPKVLVPGKDLWSSLPLQSAPKFSEASCGPLPGTNSDLARGGKTKKKCFIILTHHHLGPQCCRNLHSQPFVWQMQPG